MTYTAGNLVNVPIGEFRLGQPPTCLTTVLGSCVAIVLFSRAHHLAAMAHVLLPDSRGSKPDELPAKYADTAMSNLLKALGKVGVGASELEAVVAGGARMFQFGSKVPMLDIGALNAQAVLELLASHSIAVREKDMGGTNGRKVYFDTAKMSWRSEILETSVTSAVSGDSSKKR